MQFTTKVPIEKTNSFIDYNSKIMSLGSCFAENMGTKFDYFKFQNTTNPFGIIFNPVSIEKLVDRIVNKIEFTKKDIFFHNDLWHCFEVHSELSNPNKEEFLQTLNLILSDSFKAISNATHLIITYGTSWVYRNKSSENIVANCHKIPQNQFDKEILSVEIIQKAIQNTIYLVQKINPNCNFIFTISPVRHVKDGFVENQRSKAHLITALQSAISNLRFANYFPSYEIMMDELRDYRFYANDMLHPNSVAIEYIWERFVETTMDENEFQTMKVVDNIQKDLLHKPFNPNTENHQKFLVKVAAKIKTLQKNYPDINFSN